jgi:hypothetical protein
MHSSRFTDRIAVRWGVSVEPKAAEILTTPLQTEFLTTFEPDDILEDTIAWLPFVPWLLPIAQTAEQALLCMELPRNSRHSVPGSVWSARPDTQDFFPLAPSLSALWQLLADHAAYTAAVEGDALAQAEHAALRQVLSSVPVRHFETDRDLLERGAALQSPDAAVQLASLQILHGETDAALATLRMPHTRRASDALLLLHELTREPGWLWEAAARPLMTMTWGDRYAAWPDEEEGALIERLMMFAAKSTPPKGDLEKVAAIACSPDPFAPRMWRSAIADVGDPDLQEAMLLNAMWLASDDREAYASETELAGYYRRRGDHRLADRLEQ